MEDGKLPYIAVYCRTLPYIVVHYRTLSYIALIRNWSLLAKLVEIGGRVGGVTGVSRDSTPPLNLSFCEMGLW